MGIPIDKDAAFDTESTGIEETDVPFGFSWADSKSQEFLDERVVSNTWDIASNLFADSSRIWYAQNAKFDKRMLEAKGIKITGKIYDIAIAARVLRNDYLGKAYSLEAQAKRHGMEKDKTVELYIKDNGLIETRRNYFGVEYEAPRYDRVPLDMMNKYAAHDARITKDLATIYNSKADSDDRRIIEMECELTDVCYNMERVGVKLSEEYTLKALYHERDKLTQLKEKFKDATGKDFVNSAKSIEPLLGFSLPRTESGNPSLTDDVIDSLVHQGKGATIFPLVQDIRYYDKRISTYYESYLNKMDRKGFIHPTMWQAGTRTGRFSYSDPNLQNIPKEEDSIDPYVVRGCFVPRSTDHVFLSFDYSQMEYRLMAAYANEAEIIRQVMLGEDFHKVTANIFGVTRKQAKTLNFAILYGAGKEKLAYMLGVPVEEAEGLRSRYFMAMPNVEQLVWRIKKIGKERGYVKNWLGRKLFADYQHTYALPNHLIQGGGADVVKKAMVECSRAIDKDCLMVLQVHDQLVFDTPKELIKPTINIVKEIMENTFPTKNGMKLTVDVSMSEVSFAERDMRKVV